jgi:hypothetical protein
LHRQSVGVLTGRAAFPLMASARAIAWQEQPRVGRRDCSYPRAKR